jgi:hypothetical protein
MATETRAFTVRLPVEQAEDVEALAQVDGMSVAEVVRVSLEDRIAARRADADFTARLHKTMERNRRALERLAE